MIEMRWNGRDLEFRQRSFQVDASGAFCGVTEFDPWQKVECASDAPEKDWRIGCRVAGKYRQSMFFQRHGTVIDVLADGYFDVHDSDGVLVVRLDNDAVVVAGADQWRTT